VVFLSHFTGGGIPVLDLDVDDFWDYYDAAMKQYEMEIKMQRRVILSGIEKK